MAAGGGFIDQLGWHHCLSLIGTSSGGWPTTGLSPRAASALLQRLDDGQTAMARHSKGEERGEREERRWDLANRKNEAGYL